MRTEHVFFLFNFEQNSSWHSFLATRRVQKLSQRLTLPAASPSAEAWRLQLGQRKPSSMAERRFEDMLAFLQALKQNSAGETVTQTQERMLQGCLKDLEQGPPLTMSSASAMLAKLENGSLPDRMRSAIVCCIQAKVAAPDAEAQSNNKGKKAKNCQQSCNALQNYFTRDDWQSLQGTASFETKQQTVAKRLACLGLTNPAEGTYVLAVALLYLAHHKGPADNLQVSPQDALSTLQGLKSKVRSWAKSSSHSGLSEYPSRPEELPEDLLGRAFAGLSPMKCPLDLARLTMLAEWLPARKTKGVLNTGRQAPGFCEPQLSQNSMQQAFMWVCQQMQKQKEPLGADLTFLPRTGRTKKCLLDEPDPQPAAEAQEAPDCKKQGSELQASEQAGDRVFAQRQQLALPPPEEGAAENVASMASEVHVHLKRNKLQEQERAEPAAKKARTTKKPAEDHPAGCKKQAATEKKKEAAPPVTDKLPAKGNTAAKGPMVLQKCTVYTCPKSSNWRVKLHGERKDKAFSWKSGVNEAWSRLRAHVLTL